MWCAVLVAQAVVPALAAPAEPLANLDTYIEKALRDWRTPGLSLAVVKDDRVVLTRGYGVRKLGARERVDEQTLFALGSTSKAFAAATVAVLVNEERLQWEDRVKIYLPWLELQDPWVSNAVTVRDLLAHRVGTSYIDEDRLRAVSRDARDLLERHRWVAPVAAFRSDFVYSNDMMTASGLVVAALAQTSWAQFARERLWQPLGMNGTGADVVSARSDANAASPHVGEFSEEPAPKLWTYPDAIAVPSGGVNSNARDMAQWLRFQLGEGTIDGRVLIRRDVFKQMHTPQTVIRFPENDVQQFPPGVQARMGEHAFWAYGLGWYITEYRGSKMIWHSGTIDGFRAGVAVWPEQRLAVFVGVNRTPSLLPFALMLRIHDAYSGEAEQDWSSVFREAVTRPDPG
jgi:CubicO group peptidase (beta-lactamase class C family)